MNIRLKDINTYVNPHILNYDPLLNNTLRFHQTPFRKERMKVIIMVTIQGYQMLETQPCSGHPLLKEITREASHTGAKVSGVNSESQPGIEWIVRGKIK